jgi:MYND finger
MSAKCPPGEMAATRVVRRIGATVSIHSLVRATKYNGMTGLVVDGKGTEVDGKVSVKVETKGGESLVVRVLPENLSVTCSLCKRHDSESGVIARVCSRCQSVCYCNEACQSQHWEREHKHQCLGILEENRVLDQLLSLVESP